MEVENLVASGAEIEVVPENTQILLQLNGETRNWQYQSSPSPLVGDA
jgi:hypothetical protein